MFVRHIQTRDAHIFISCTDDGALHWVSTRCKLKTMTDVKPQLKSKAGESNHQSTHAAHEHGYNYTDTHRHKPKHTHAHKQTQRVHKLERDIDLCLSNRRNHMSWFFDFHILNIYWIKITVWSPFEKTVIRWFLSTGITSEIIITLHALSFSDVLLGHFFFLSSLLQEKLRRAQSLKGMIHFL